MDVAKAFTFVTEDERWVGKIGIGALISLLAFLILPIPLLAGYLVGVTRNVMTGEARPLPEWEDFGTLFKDGLSIIMAQLVYTLPLWILACISFLASVGLSNLSEVSEDVAAAGFLATFGLVGCLTLLVLIALFFISPAIVIQYVRTNELSACFRFSEIMAIVRNHMGNIVIAALAPFAASMVLGFVLSILSIIPIVGWCGVPIISIAVGPYLLAVTGHLYGQIGAGMDSKVEKFA